MANKRSKTEAPPIETMSEMETVRDMNIARNADYLKNLGFEPPNEIVKAVIVKRKREIPLERTRVTERVPKPVFTKNQLDLQKPLTLPCPLCEGWNSSVLMPANAQQQLLDHQAGPSCKLAVAEKTMPRRDRTLETKSKQRAVLRQQDRTKVIKAGDHEGKTFVECFQMCGHTKCTFKGLFPISQAKRSLSSHEVQVHPKIGLTRVVAEVAECNGDADAGDDYGDDDDAPCYLPTLPTEEHHVDVAGIHDDLPTLQQNKSAPDAKLAPNETILNHQKVMIAELNRPRILRKGKSTEIMLHLFAYGTSENLSINSGNKLLATLWKILDVVGQTNLVTHKSWKDLLKACRGNLKSFSGVTEFAIPLGTTFFPKFENGRDGKLTNATTCFSANILSRIGEALLQVKQSEFHKTPLVLTDAKGERLFGPFPSGEKFARHCEFVGDLGFPLMMQFYYDRAACSSTRGICPLVFNICNATGKSFRPHILAYCPVELAYSTPRLKELCKAHFDGKANVDHVKFACDLAMRRATDSFLFNVLKPILDFQQCGLKVQIGSGKDATVGRAFLFLSHWCGDSAELNVLQAVRVGSKENHCRVCTGYSKVGGGTVGIPRNPVTMEKMTRDLELSHLVAMKAGPRSVLSDEMQASVKEANSFGVMGGVRLLPKILDSVPKEVNTHAQSVPADCLHTAVKGTGAEVPLSCGLQIIHAVAKNKKKKYTDFAQAHAHIDDATVNFPSKHALHPFNRHWHFSGGATTFLKSGSKKGGKQGASAGMLTGGTPAWQLPILLLQVLFCVADNNINLLPNKKCVVTSYGVVHNPTKVLIDGMCSSLQALWLLKSKTANAHHLDLLLEATKKANVCNDTMFDLKQTILRANGDFKKKKKTLKGDIKPTSQTTLDGETKKKTPPPKVGRVTTQAESSTAMKKHLWLHFSEQAVEFGQDQRSTDTELGESAVKETVQVSWTKSNKQKRHSERMMLNYGIAKEFAMMLVQTQCKENESNPFRPRLPAEPDEKECEHEEEERTITSVVHVIPSFVCGAKFTSKPLKYKVVVNMGASNGYGKWRMWYYSSSRSCNSDTILSSFVDLPGNIYSSQFPAPEIRCQSSLFTLVEKLFRFDKLHRNHFVFTPRWWDFL